MQLKMANNFQPKLVKQILIREHKYITDIISRMPLSITEMDSYEEADEENNRDNHEEKEDAHLVTGKGTKRAQTLEELHARLEGLKNKGRLDYRDKKLKKGLKNKMKKKSKVEERLMKKKLARTEKMASGSIGKEENGDIPRIPRQKPIFNSEGHMVFSKFDFSQVGTKTTTKSEKNSKKILQKVEKKNEKVKKLIELGERDKAEEIKSKEAWKTVLAKASGKKIKDDPELLKKSIKREEQRKKQSSKKWETRIQGVQKSIQEKQQKRQENIMKKKKEKKMNKLKKAVKKGRILSGH